MIGQLLRSRVAWTVVDGRVAVREGQVIGVDEVALAHDASRILSRLWAQARVPEPAPPSPPVRRA
jgi:hypothetical protein